MAFLRYVAFAFTLVFSLQVHADYPASQSWLAGWPGGLEATGASCEGALAAWFAQYGGTNTGSPCPNPGDFCQSTNARRCYGTVAPQGMTCPNGGTLSGNTCVHTCPQGKVENPDGSCVNPPDPCKSKENTSAGGGWITVPRGGDPTGKSCDGGCQVSTALDTSAGYYYTDGKTITQRYVQSFTGQSCTNEQPKPSTTEPTKAPAEPPKKPPCASGEGVMTSSSGTIACVPEGAPGSNPPIVTKQKSVETNPDGSSKITETTTTRDPATGAETKSVSITITPASNGSPGTAGTPGTTAGPSTSTSTTTGGDPTKPGDSDFCAKNPGLQICKGGMNEEATQKAIKEILSPSEQPNMSAIETAKQEIQQKEQAHKQLFEDWGAKGQSDANGWFAWAMIPEVPAGTCQPFTGSITGRQITLDWCDQLERIRQIAGYAFYIFTAFALFAIFNSAFSRGGNK